MTEQEAYDKGYDNPTVPLSRFKWGHLVDANACWCGQVDRQNQHPRAQYEREAYDPIAGERIDGFKVVDPQILTDAQGNWVQCEICRGLIDSRFRYKRLGDRFQHMGERCGQTGSTTT